MTPEFPMPWQIFRAVSKAHTWPDGICRRVNHNGNIVRARPASRMLRRICIARAYRRMRRKVSPSEARFIRRHMTLVHEATVCRCNEQHCMLCEGGLFLCKICGALEGALLPTCPGRQLSYHDHEVNYRQYCTGRGPFRHQAGASHNRARREARRMTR